MAALHSHTLGDDYVIDIAELVGPYTWRLLHQAVDTFPCHPCAESGGRLLRGLHDVVNWHTGKPVQYPEDLEYLREEVNQVPIQPGGVRAAPDLAAEVARLAQGVGLMAKKTFPRCTRAAAKRHERCVQKVKVQGTAASPQAVCTVSVGCSPRRKS